MNTTHLEDNAEIERARSIESLEIKMSSAIAQGLQDSQSTKRHSMPLVPR